jgi:hypothetical protein
MRAQSAKKRTCCFAGNLFGSSGKKKEAYHDTPDFDSLFAR